MKNQKNNFHKKRLGIHPIINQAEFGRRLGHNRSYMSLIINGHKGQSPKKIKQIAVSLMDLSREIALNAIVLNTIAYDKSIDETIIAKHKEGGT